MENLKTQFNSEGYLVIEGVFKDQASDFIAELDRISHDIKKTSWTLPDGVFQNKKFWPVLFNKTILSNLRSALGEEIKVLQHNDLHLGYSSFAWHRDSINRSYAVDSPNWLEEDEQYLVARCGCYLQDEKNDFHLGVVPGSHKPGFLADEQFLEYDKKLTNFSNAKVKLGMKDLLKERAVWIKTKPGDCVLFDPRLIHTGGEFESIKYSFFTAFGIENRHFRQHSNYYRYLRKDLSYQAIPQTLREQLIAKNLYASEEQYYEKIRGAFIPSSAFAFVANMIENS